MTQRLLFVHAHPDDETLTCGIAMAHHVARGDEVHVLTCTLGEEGEVIPADLAHLEGHPEDALAPHRLEELTRALEVVGARLHLLGDDGTGRPRYRDSGMAGSPAAQRPEAFAGADVDEAAALVARVVRDVRPDVVVTYEAQGGYGHPDHIQAHRVTRRALAGLADEELPAAVYEIVTPLAWAREDRRWLGQHVDPAAGLTVPPPDAPFPPSVVPDGEVTHVVEDGAARRVKNEALRAHATQVVVVSEDVHALSNLIAARTAPREAFRRVDPRTWAPLPGPVRRGPLGS